MKCGKNVNKWIQFGFTNTCRRKRLSKKFFNILTFFSLDWKMITVDMFSKNIKPNVCKNFSQMDVLLNNKTLKNIYNLHEHKVNIY